MINTAGYAAGSLPGSFIFPSDFGPSYRNSFVVTLLAFSAAICLVLLTRRHLAHLNVELSTVSTPIELSVHAPPRTTQSRLEAAATVNSALASLASRQQLCVRPRKVMLTTQSLPVHPLNVAFGPCCDSACRVCLSGTCRRLCTAWPILASLVWSALLPTALLPTVRAFTLRNDWQAV